MRKWLLLIPFTLFGLDVQPWFGNLYQLHALGSYSYKHFPTINHANPQLKRPFNASTFSLDLGCAVSPQWSADTEIQLATTTSQSFSFRSLAFQGRYLWLDDIAFDSVSLATGASARFTSSPSLRDVSCPSHGHLDMELNISVGKEVAAMRAWLFRGWFFGAIGQATRGSPWIRAIGALETNLYDQHKFAVFSEWINGYGRRSSLNPNRFFGYGKMREKGIDLGIRYGYSTGIWGTARFEYIRRVFAKASPERSNTYKISYFFPFSF